MADILFAGGLVLTLILYVLVVIIGSTYIILHRVTMKEVAFYFWIGFVLGTMTSIIAVLVS